MEAWAYLRTSSAANVEGDSAPRQMAAIERGAAVQRCEIIASFWDAAVSGAIDTIDRPGFRAMLDEAERQGVTTIICESLDRFARDLMVQETGIRALERRGLRLITADGAEHTNRGQPVEVLNRHVNGAVAQFIKAQTVQRLASGRKGARDQGQYAGGFRPVIGQEVAALAQGLRAASASLREIAAKLAELGHVSASGKPFGPETVKRLISGGRNGPRPKAA